VKLLAAKLVKLLFSSSEMPEVVFVKSVLVRAGIRCEIRHQDAPAAAPEIPAYPELWILDEGDFLAASMLFASRRGRRSPSVSQPVGNAG
jgi:hypothetical protein